jgi:hypothetical protein
LGTVQFENTRYQFLLDHDRAFGKIKELLALLD